MDVLTPSTKRTLIVIAGPTAVGKTALAIQLAKEFQTSILSFDSRQFYREMIVGTAKPSTEDLAAVPHYFIDNLSIHDHYTSGMFETEALQKLDELFQDTDTVIAVGGSGLYIQALCYGIDDIPSDTAIRNILIQRWQAGELDLMIHELKEVDFDFYQTSDMQNPRRVIRGLEVYHKTGIPYSKLRRNTHKTRPFEICWIGLSLEREILYDRINRRVDHMLEAGLVSEARNLYPLRDLQALRTVGYQELFEHFDGAYDLDKAVELIKRNSRIYARKQVTWFKRNPDIHWFEPDNIPAITSFISEKKQK